MLIHTAYKIILVLVFCIVKYTSFINVFVFYSILKDDMPAIITCKPHAGLAFLAPEPEDVEDLYSRYKV